MRCDIQKQHSIHPDKYPTDSDTGCSNSHLPCSSHKFNYLKYFITLPVISLVLILFQSNAHSSVSMVHKYDDVILALFSGNSPATGEFPTQRPVMGSFDVFFHLGLTKQLIQQSWGWWFETASRTLWLHYDDKPFSWWAFITSCWNIYRNNVSQSFIHNLLIYVE